VYNIQWNLNEHLQTADIFSLLILGKLIITGYFKVYITDTFMVRFWKSYRNYYPKSNYILSHIIILLYSLSYPRMKYPSYSLTEFCFK